MTNKSRKSTRKPAVDTADLMAKLDAYLAEADEDETFLAKIAVWNLRYSERNAQLIVMQAPEATDVAGYRAWQDRGRQVRKGETGIRILAPAGQRDAQDAQTDATGNVTAEAKSARRFYKLISVFDISQTMTAEQAAAEAAAREAE